MLPKKERIAVFIILCSLSIWGCSSGSKTKPRIQPQPAEANPAIQNPEKPEKNPASTPKPLNLAEALAALGDDRSAEIQEKTPANEKVDAQASLEAALLAYQEAQQAWEQGDFDLALKALDEAYAKIVKIHLPNDSPLVQEKNDLRLLIAQRIQQIYASRPKVAGDNRKIIPLEENKWVLREIELFKTQERKYFEEAYKRSGLYRPMIIEELRKAGMPVELSWLPMIESWFQVRALSSARALGMWQFIASTGYRMGLKQRDRWVDERMDPFKSTQAAVKYLGELHAMFGDWTTALAAYNCGEFHVQNVIKRQRIDYMDNFWDLYAQLPVQTARYVPRFIAAVLIINNPEKYGMSLPESLPPIQYDTVAINHPTKLSTLAEKISVQPAELAFLNPELRQDATPNYEYILRVPVGLGETASASINEVPRWIPTDPVTHYVSKGETLSLIAQKYGIKWQAIANLNGLNSRSILRLGQRLMIPVRGVPETAVPADVRNPKGAFKSGGTTAAGNSNSGQAAGSSNSPVTRGNGNGNAKDASGANGASPAVPRSGKPSTKPEGALVYKVETGDTIFGIAQKFGMSLQDFLTLNGLAAESIIYPGQELLVVPKK